MAVEPYVNWMGQMADEKDAESILGSFAGPEEIETLGITPEDMELIAAYYSYEDYTGEALVVYRDRRDGSVYEVSGGHCSCYGLEGQWSPELAVVEELVNRPHLIGSYWDDADDEDAAAFRAKLREALT